MAIPDVNILGMVIEFDGNGISGRCTGLTYSRPTLVKSCSHEGLSILVQTLSVAS